MASALVDRGVLIDLLRRHPPALTWIRSQAEPAVTRVVHLELLEGPRDRLGEKKALKLLDEFELIEMGEPDFEWATAQLIRFHLSQGVGMMDCLIAAPVYRLHLPLFTQNMKHFTPLLGPLAQKPY